MQDFIHFLIKYWYLSVPFIISVILLIVEEARTKGMFRKLSIQQAILLFNQGEAVIIDIREKPAYKEGHVLQAINMPKRDLVPPYSQLERYQKKKIILICANGQQSGAIAMDLYKNGFEHAVVLAGGMQAWQQAGMPVVKK